VPDSSVDQLFASARLEDAVEIAGVVGRSGLCGIGH